MELAGLSVAQAIYKSYPPQNHSKVFIISGPGNNGGDGIVAARHLVLLGYKPSVFYFRKSDKFSHLETQMKSFGVPVYTPELEKDEVNLIEKLIYEHHLIVDAMFGFSFRPPLRTPFDRIIPLLNESKKPVVAVDLPTGWDVDSGPNVDSVDQSQILKPEVLVSLTAPKPASKFFKGVHYLGGRFISKVIAEKYDFEVPSYEGLDEVVRVD